MKDLNKTDRNKIGKTNGEIRGEWDRRDFLKCVGAWAGTGVVLAMAGGVLTSCKIEETLPGTLS